MGKKKISGVKQWIVPAVTMLLLIHNVCSAQILQRTRDKVNEKLEELIPPSRFQEDSHPEYPTLEELLRDSTLFKCIQRRAKRYGDTFILRSGMIVTYDGPTIGLYSFEGKLIYKIPNEKAPYIVFIDSVGNFYCNHRKYLFPDYAKSIAYPYMDVADTFGRFQHQCHYGGGESDSVDQRCYHQKTEDFRRRWALPLGDPSHCQSSDFFGPHRGFLVNDRIGRPQVSNFSLPNDTLTVVDESVRIYLYKRLLFRDRIPYDEVNYYALPNGMRCKTTQIPHVYRYQGKVYLLTQTGMYLML